MVVENRKKYLKAPNLSLIEKVIKKFDVSESHFELFFGIPSGTIKAMRYNSTRQMPAKYWHLFYDPPKRSTVTREDANRTVTKTVTKKESEIVPPKSKSKEKATARLGELLS